MLPFWRGCSIYFINLIEQTTGHKWYTKAPGLFYFISNDFHAFFYFTKGIIDNILLYFGSCRRNVNEQEIITLGTQSQF